MCLYLNCFHELSFIFKFISFQTWLNYSRNYFWRRLPLQQRRASAEDRLRRHHKCCRAEEKRRRHFAKKSRRLFAVSPEPENGAASVGSRVRKILSRFGRKTGLGWPGEHTFFYIIFELCLHKIYVPTLFIYNIIQNIP